MKNFHFTFFLSGKDVRNRPIVDTATYSFNIVASTQKIAEKKLRAHYYKSVIVNIQSVQATEVNTR